MIDHDKASPTGAKLRELRRRKGLTQSALGETLGVTKQYVGAIERGARPGGLRLVLRWVDACDGSVADVLGADEGLDELLAGLVGLPPGKRRIVGLILELADRLDDVRFDRLEAMLAIFAAEQT